MREDCICDSPGALRIPCHAIWVDICPRSFPKTNAASCEPSEPSFWTRFRLSLPRRHFSFHWHTGGTPDPLADSYLSDEGLKLKLSKCRFAQRELEYLGHIVSRDGVKTNPRLIAAVQNFPIPQSVHDMRRFLGLASYYRRFICNFARIAHPLHQLICKGAEFLWTEDCRGAFWELKERLTTAPVLAYPASTIISCWRPTHQYKEMELYLDSTRETANCIPWPMPAELKLANYGAHGDENLCAYVFHCFHDNHQQKRHFFL